MTLRKATITFICLSTLTLLLAHYTVTHIAIKPSFDELERDHAVRNMERARNAVAHELRNLDDLVLDWAVWNDSKNFMQGRAPDYAHSNMNDRSLDSLHLTAIVFIDRKGKVVWAQGFDPVQGVKAPLPDGLMAELSPGSPLLAATSIKDRAKGLMLLPQGVMLTATCPITGSDGLGPAIGTLIMVRPLTSKGSADIAENVRLPITLERADTPMSSDIAPLLRDHTGGLMTGAISSDIYCAVLILPDFLGRPALRVVLRDTREVMNLGDNAMNMDQIWAILGIISSFAILALFLEVRVLRRLGHLKAQVESIGADAEGRNEGCRQTQPTLDSIDMPGNDELSALALRINETLAELERSRRNLATQCAMTQEQESYLQQILDSIQAGVILVDPQTRMIREVNAFAAACAGLPREALAGKLCHGFLSPDADGNCPIANLGQSGEQTLRNLTRPDGSDLPVLTSVSHIERSGKPLLLETFIDVEELQRAQEALKRSEEKYRAVFMNTGTATILIETDATISLANQEFEKLSGCSKQDVEGKRKWTDFFASRDVEWMLEHHVKRRQSAGQAPRNYETHFVNSSGEERITLLTVGMIPGSDVSVASIENITERKLAEEQLRHQAFHDSLTGLPNRQLLQDRLERSVESARRDGQELGVLLMDLDRFKDINDSLGHSAGDRLLKLVAARLEQTVRRSDTVARLGGDEFVLVVDGPANQEAAGKVAQHILDSISQPFDLDGQSLHVGLSVGIALFPLHGETPEVLLKNADLAMYRAKEDGRNTFAIFTEELNDKVMQRFAIEAGLRRALSSGGIEVFYQPKVVQPGNIISGAEALVRWRREDGALVSPAEFIPVAENTGIIMHLSELVLRHACMQAVKWRTGAHTNFVVAVNLSPRQFLQPGLTERIRAIMDETGVPPQALEFEITENLLLDNRPETLATLCALRDMGASIVLDDFGKEYSSLSYIKKLPIQAIKIDRSFIDGLPNDEDDASIVKSVLSLAQNLDLRVVAEGVETSAQLDLLASLGCREFQGYLFSRPVPALDMTELLAQASPFATS